MIFDKPTPIRDGFGKALLELGEKNPQVVVLTADLSEAIRVHWFAEKFPKRFFQMGIAESDMVGTAAGLAVGGKIPFVTTFAAFATSLANTPVRVSVAYNQANVKIATSHGGVCVGGDGATHQSIEDIALMRVLPGMTIVVPCDANEAYKATLAAAEFRGPLYLRLGRIATPVFTKRNSPFRIGKAQVLEQGSDLAIIACGAMVGLALEASRQLRSKGIYIRVINMHTVKPLDQSAVLKAARECGAIVTLEEHSVIGGLGSAVTEVVSEKYPVPVERVGIQDVFGESGEPDEILSKYGLTTKDLLRACKRVLERKDVKNRA
ncbi:MAG: transketolase family protein [Spirochaetes bacterium]|nr:transketolase family protein [Spirochaetota bacterium]